MKQRPLTLNYRGVTSSFSEEKNKQLYSMDWGGVVATWLVRSPPHRVVQVQARPGETELCSWSRHLTLTVSLSTQRVQMGTAEFNAGGNPAMG